MQQGMVLDQGSAFESSFSQTSEGTEVTISKCLYHEILTAEDKGHLLRVCCCSQDASWCVAADPAANGSAIATTQLCSHVCCLPHAHAQYMASIRGRQVCS